MVSSLRRFYICSRFLKHIPTYCKGKPDFNVNGKSVLLNNFNSNINTTSLQICSQKRFYGALIRQLDTSSHSPTIKFSTSKKEKNLTAECLFDIQGFMKKDFHSGLSGDFIFRQFLEYKSYTYSYLLADPSSREAIIIDPVIETVERDLRLVKNYDLKLVYGLNTHVHADHITGTGELKKHVQGFHSIISANSGAKADIKIQDGDFIKFGQYQLEAVSTPGHTNGCTTYIWHEKGMVFTGDALLIRGCGRTDFQQGDSDMLYESVHKKIFSLPDHYCVFPAHDYTGQTMSTVGEEKKFNPRLTKPKAEFIEVMNKLSLPYPKQIDIALPANLVCGVFDDVKP